MALLGFSREKECLVLTSSHQFALHKQRRLLLFITEVRRLFMIMVQEQNELPFFLYFFLNKRLRGMQVKEEVTGKEMKRKIPGRGRV